MVSRRFLPVFLVLLTALASCTQHAGTKPEAGRAAAASPLRIATEHVPVAIVGAGLTGLTLAYELEKAGIEYRLLESSVRIGGRIQTVSIPGGPYMEAHMEEYFARSPAYALLKELGVSLASDVAHSSVRIDGKIRPYHGEGARDDYARGFCAESEVPAFRDWHAKTWKIYEALHKCHYEGQPLTPELEALTKISFADWVRADKLPHSVEEWIRVTVEPEMAIEWEDICALDGIDEMRLFLDSPDGFGETNYHCKGGNTHFIEALAARVRPGSIQTRSRVTAIDQRGATAIVRYLRDDAVYQELAADTVVVTTPLYQLRNIQFTPPLSAEKQQAIATTKFGSYIKIHLLVGPDAAPLWEQNGQTVLTLLSDSAVGSIYEATHFQGAGEKSDRLLTLLLHARYARALLDKTADEMRDEALKGLDAIFPGISKHVRVCELYPYPTAVAYWPLKLGRSRFDHLADALRAKEGRLYIGGDSTEDSHSEGAVQAALRISKELIKSRPKKGGQVTPSKGRPTLVRAGRY
ncbi:MAG: FAD-dependent oxidoreductase [Planctomycetes bacterium]|nr:FAD-dependent oxidoreductase [Planctomycetota bacterium]